MKMTPIAMQIVASAFLAAAPWPALAQTQGERDGAEVWFNDYIEPSLGRHVDDMSIEQPLYEGNEAHAPAARIPPPERRLYRHTAEFGSTRAVLVAGDLPPTRTDRIDVQDWNDRDSGNPMRAEMFRFYFEPVAPTAPICRAIIP